MATAKPSGVVTLPPASRRPGSATFSDVYGALALGGVTTAAAGGEGAARSAEAAAAGGAPITVHGIGPDFVKSPAGMLVVLVIALAAWSYFD